MIERQIRVFRIRALAANVVLPSLMGAGRELFTAAFNPNLAGDLTARLAFGLKPLIYAVTALFGLAGYAAVMRAIRPLLSYVRGSGDEGTARTAPFALPWIMLTAHGGFWLIGTTGFYALYGFRSPGGVPYGVALALTVSWGLAIGMLCAMIVEDGLEPLKIRLAIREVRPGERDVFARVKNPLAAVTVTFSLTAALVHLSDWAVAMEAAGAPVPAATRYAAFAGASAVAIAFVALLLTVSNSSFRSRMRSLERQIAELAAGEGDLTGRIDLTSFDEAGVVGARVNAFLEKLASMVARMKAVAEDAASSVTVLRTSVEESERFMREFAATVSGVLDAFSEERAQVDVADKGADSIAESTEESLSAAATQERALTEATGAVESMLQGVREVASTADVIRDRTDEFSKTIHDLSATTKALFAQIDRLGERAAAMREGAMGISDVAERINLISLNASIEAAHAGERGKGFAVVAGEVRSLAARTAAGAQSIGERIDEVDDAANESGNAVQAIRASLNRIEAAVVDIERSLETLSAAGNAERLGADRISEAMKTSLAAADAVRAISENQRDRSAAIVACMGKLEEITRRTDGISRDLRDRMEALAASNQAVATIADRQVRLADELREMTARFKT